MSYQPEPDFEKEYPRTARWRRRMFAFYRERPLAFWLRAWVAAVIYFVLLWALDAPFMEGGIVLRVFLLFSLLGWVVPFIIWIRKRKSDKT